MFTNVKQFLSTCTETYGQKPYRLYQYDVLNKIKKIVVPNLNLQIEIGVLPANECIPFTSINPTVDRKYTSYVKFTDTNRRHLTFHFDCFDINFATSREDGIYQGINFNIITIGRDGRNNIIYNDRSVKRFEMCFEIDVDTGMLKVYK